MDSSFLIIALVVVGVIIAVVAMTFSGSLNSIKSKKVGDGQLGDADWKTNKQIREEFKRVIYSSPDWRMKKNLPTHQGTVIHTYGIGKRTSALVDTEDNHTLMISAPGAGKTMYWLYLNLEYTCACGMSFLATSTKKDIYENFAGIAQQHYEYKPLVLDFYDSRMSCGYNLMHQTNKYMDLYKSTGILTHKAKAEKYAKITANTIVHMDGFAGGGQNSYFYDAAEGFIASAILLISEFLPQKQRHIVNAFLLIQQLLQTDPLTLPKKKTDPPPSPYSKRFFDMIPNEHMAKMLASSTLSSANQSQASVLSTAMSRLLSFIDSDVEQIICFDSDFTAEEFAEEKRAVFVVFPETDKPKQFLVSLFIRQFYNELIEIANEMGKNSSTGGRQPDPGNEKGGYLNRRAYFYLDEYGTMGKFDDAEGMFSAGRSRNIFQVAFIQSLSQLNRNYGKDGAETILDCCKNIVFGPLSPLSKSADELSRSLGAQTVQTGSVSHNADRSSTTFNMAKRSLMTPDAIKRLKRGEWIYNNGTPFKTSIQFFNKYNIKLDIPFSVKQQDRGKVTYMNIEELMHFISAKHKVKPVAREEVEESAEEKDPIYTEVKTISDDYLKP